MRIIEQQSDGQFREIDASTLGVKPKYTDKIAFFQKQGRDYYVYESPVAVVLYLRTENKFGYACNGSVVMEDMCYESGTEARSEIQRIEKMREGDTYVQYVDKKKGQMFQKKVN